MFTISLHSHSTEKDMFIFLVLTLCCCFDHLHFFFILTRALFSAGTPSSSDHLKATQSEHFELTLQELHVSWWKMIEMTLSVDCKNMQSTTDREEKLNEDIFTIEALWRRWMMKSSLFSFCHRQPHVYLSWTNTELMRAGCMTWTVPPCRTLCVSPRLLRKGSEAERLALRFQHNDCIHFHSMRHLH